MSDYESEFLYIEEPETPAEITFRPNFDQEFTDERENYVSDPSASTEHSQLVTFTTELAAETQQPDSECFESEDLHTSCPERGPTLAEEVSFAHKRFFFVSINTIIMPTDAES